MSRDSYRSSMLSVFWGALLVTSPLLAYPPGKGANSETPAARPVLEAELVDGSIVRGTLREFRDGVYVLDVDGRELRLKEDSLRRIGAVAADAPAAVKIPVDEQAARWILEIERKRDFAAERADEAEHGRRRREAVDGLGAAGPKNLAAIMESIRRDEKYAYWPSYWHAMRRWPSESLAAIEKYVDDPNDRVRRTVAEVAGTWNVETVPTSIVKLSDDRDASVRWSASDAAVTLSKSPKSVVRRATIPLLFSSLRDQDMHDEYRRRAGDRLAELALSEREIIGELLKLLAADPHEEVRETIAGDLRGTLWGLKADDPDTTRIIAGLEKAIVNDPSEYVRGYALSSLGAIAQENETAAAILMRASDSSVRATAERAKLELERARNKSRK